MMSVWLVRVSALTFASVAVMAGCRTPTERTQEVASAEKRARPDVQAGLRSAEVALERSEWAAAETQLRALLAERLAEKDAGRARRGLAEVLYQTGRLRELLAFASGPESWLIRGRVLLAQGQPEAALRAVEADSSVEAQLLAGESLLELGRRPEAERVFTQLVEGWPRSDGTEVPLELVEKQRAVARAAFLLRDPRLSDALFAEVAERGNAAARSRLWEAELFLERHDPAGALRILGQFLEQAPHHPEALLLLGRFKIEQSFDFVGAASIAEQVLEISPAHPDAAFLLASLALQDLDFAAARQSIALGLGRNPRALSLLSLRAAAALLAEEPAVFEDEVRRFAELSPGSARLFSVVSELAEWEHRYPDIEDMSRRAVRLDPGDPKVRARLAMTLLRAGSEAQGLVELRRAFELDPYDVRTYNSLTLFESIIPEEYETHERPGFRFRFPKGEAQLLLRYVPDLVQAAAAEYERRYQMRAPSPITIELYRSRDQFGVRTSGLTHIGLEGVCFGQRIAALSPAAGPGNLGMTLWHEMAHVFHLTASKGRVPRWLTEGYAEWETARLGRGWHREAERALFIAERQGRVPDLLQLNRAFTRARSHSDIAAAYFASGALGRFLDETDPALFPHWLRELGKPRVASEVFRESLPDSSAFMGRFRASLEERFRRFDEQLVLDESAGFTGAPVSPRGMRPSAPEESAFALAAAGDLPQAQRALFELWQTAPNSRVGLALARLSVRARDLDGARELLDRSIELGPDGVELRLERARLASATGDFDALGVHATRAAELDPEETEAWVLLATADRKRAAPEGELRALERWAELDETSAIAHIRLLELLLDARRYPQAARAAERALWVALGHPRIHDLAARAFEKSGDRKRAAFERETFRLLSTRDPADLP